jgi:hypothetical protein
VRWNPYPQFSVLPRQSSGIGLPKISRVIVDGSGPLRWPLKLSEPCQARAVGPAMGRARRSTETLARPPERQPRLQIRRRAPAGDPVSCQAHELGARLGVIPDACERLARSPQAEAVPDWSAVDPLVSIVSSDAKALSGSPLSAMAYLLALLLARMVSARFW